MRIAIIGCGGIGAAHARGYLRLDPPPALVFLDLVRERAERLAGEFGGTAGVFPHDLPADIAGASVTTPPARHYEVADVLLRAGVPTFCEKPLTLQSGRGIELAGTARRSGVPLLVGFKMRFEPVFTRAKREIERLGDLYAVSVTKCQPYRPRPQEDWVPDVGAMFELASHDFDMVYWLTGLEPETVQARLHSNPGWRADTRFSITVAYSGGIPGHFVGGYSEETTFRYRDMTHTFIGRKGYVRVERPNRIVSHLDQVNEIDLGEVDTDTFPAELGNFVSVIRDEATPFIAAEEANRVTQLVEAARVSARSGVAERVRPG